MASMAYFLSLQDLYFQLSLARQKIMYENKICICISNKL